MFYKEYFIYNIENTSLDAGTGVAFTDTTTRFDRDNHFEAHKFIHTATDDRIYMRFSDNAYGRFYENLKLDLRSISGTALSGITANGFTPFVLPSPLMVHGGTTLTTQMSDFSGSANSVRLALHGAKIKNGKAPWNDPNIRERVPFFMTGRKQVSANSTENINISINFDADFLIHKITGTRDGAALVTIQDAAERAWMDAPVHIDNLIGNGQFPNNLAAKRMVKFGSVINITIQELSGSDNDIDITFIGEKLYRK